jgi:endothelin-converting enzyme/putative endopeptidase
LRRSSILAVAAVLAACQPKLRRPPGDEAPYPTLDSAAIDRTAAPCEDFYRYACGRWVAETAVPPDRTTFARAAGEIEERNARLLRRILDDARDGKVDPRDRFGRKAGDFYGACMEEADVDARGLAELQAEWARIDAIADGDALAEELARLTAMGIAVPYTVRASVAPDDPRRAVLVLEAGGLGLGEPARYLAEGTGAAELRDRYVDHLKKELALAGVAAGEIDALARRTFDLERDLAAARGPREEPPATTLRSALPRLAPGFPWERLLHAVGAGARTRVALAEPAFAAALGRLFVEEPLERWRAYLRWRLAEVLADQRALPAPLVEERFRFQSLLLPTAPEPRPRWKHCVDLTGRAFGVGLGATFGRRHLGAGGRDRAARIAAAVEEGLAAALDAAPWADRATRTRAAEKLEDLEMLVGFPDAGPDYDKLKVSRSRFLRNVFSAGRFAVAREVARAERPVDRAEWLSSPLEAAPSYAPERNALCVPAGALQPPTWNRDAPDPVTYGGFGAQVGRTLAEVIGEPGRRRGPEGEAVDWWSPEAARRFEERAVCVAEQYDAFLAGSGSEVGTGGARALASNLADLAGVRAAYEAMKAARSDGAAGPKQLGFTPDQQFFLAYAQSLCTAALVAEGTAGEVPAHFRVNGPLSNLPEFASAFRCEAGSYMARPEAARCEVW